ncbi:MAG: SLBB domain-containing protein [Gemmatimonadaceae bacterium]|nr:SLBB domain-containing protein [Gemmatimonadaceae bacterium]
MNRLLLRPLLAVGVFLYLASGVHAQTVSPQQAQQLLQNRPDLLNQLRQRIGGSGLTPDQIRARLRAQGYPDNLLDSYLQGEGRSSTDPTSSAQGTPALPGMPGQAGSTSGMMPTPDVFSALRELGIADSSDFDFPGDTNRTKRILGDSLQTPFDSTLDPRIPTDVRGRDGRKLTSYEQYLWLRTDSIQRDSGLKVFGLDLFSARNASQFDANLAGPVDASYRLGPGDRLVLILTGDVEQAHSLEVTREGFVVIPQVGQLSVANLTMAQLEDLLYSRLSRSYSGVRRGPGATTRFSVSMARLRTNQIFVVGDVARPGSYRVSAAGTALTALYAAGGPTMNGSLRAVQVRRNGRVVGTIDLYDYLVRGDASRDQRLLNGDIVFVPIHTGRVRVVGEVSRPGTYEVGRDGSLADIVRAAGGLLPTAARSRIQVERLTAARDRTRPGSDRAVLDVSGGTGDVPALALVDGDVIRVLKVADRVRNRVVLRGNVFTPGTVGLTPGMRLSEAIRKAGGLKPDTYLGQVLISRLNSDSTRSQLRATLADTLGTVVGDPVLQEEDEIRVFGRSEFRPIRYVAITGAVRRSGRYPYQDGMTMRDLVLLAGGLQESAMLNEAEVARMPRSRVDGLTATTMRVPMDSSYLFERGPDGRYAGPPGMAGAASGTSEVVLDPYDNVLILRQPDWELQRTVFVGGEVRFPGSYTLVKKSERLSDVLQRAGGLTKEAYADGVNFSRRRNRIGRIGVDLPAVLKDGQAQDNIILFDGDSITIPRYDAVVRVDGAVNSPTALPYVRGKDMQYYIRAAGGGRLDADLPRTYVTQPNGRVDAVSRRLFLPDGQPTPRPGAVVTVPKRDRTERQDTLASRTQIASIIGTFAAVLASLATIIIQTR